MGNVERLMTVQKTYYPLANLSQVIDADLAYVQILMVSRSGVLYFSDDDVTWLSDTGLFCQHLVSLGIIDFGVPF